MIRTPTVLIAGAGASTPYGIPAGVELRKRVLRFPGFSEFAQGRIPTDQTVNSLLFRLTGAQFNQLWPSVNRLAHPSTESIDALLERHPTDALLQSVGKILIAWGLGQSLRTSLDTWGSAGDWIQFVWRQMYVEAQSFDQLASGNRLRFVTFNFDTLIEHRLSQAIAILYPGVSYPQARTFMDSLVTHVHGTLEPPSEPELRDEWLSDAQKRIAIVHEARNDDILKSARAEIEKADVVAFLGFGYHEANVKKLGFPIHDAGSRGPMFGTAKDLGNGERPEIVRLFGNFHRLVMGAEDEDCLQFLRSHHVLRG